MLSVCKTLEIKKGINSRFANSHQKNMFQKISHSLTEVLNVSKKNTEILESFTMNSRHVKLKDYSLFSSCKQIFARRAMEFFAEQKLKFFHDTRKKVKAVTQ